MAIRGQNASVHKRPIRPIVGSTLDGQRPMLFDYWRTGYGKPEVDRLPHWVAKSALSLVEGAGDFPALKIEHSPVAVRAPNSRLGIRIERGCEDPRQTSA